jgi:hypothetical protein
MPAPSNDSWEAAILLNGAFVRQAGTNVEATDDEGGEASVWYQWLNVPAAQVNDLIAVTTRAHSTGAQLNFRTDFDTRLRIFRRLLINGDVELGPLIASSDPADNMIYRQGTYDDYAAYSLEAEALFARTGNTNVFIAVSGKAGATGKFHLSFFHPYARYLTSRCVQKAARFTALAQAALPNVAGPSTTQFITAAGVDTFAAGRYRVQYCSGAFRHNITRPVADWVTLRLGLNANPALFNGTYFVRVNHSAGERAYFDQATSTLVPVATQLRAETLARCRYTEFEHAGGPIAIEFIDDLYSDNLPGTSLPAFTLYQRNAAARFEISRRVGSSGFTATVYIRNVTGITQFGVRAAVYEVAGRDGFFPAALQNLGNLAPDAEAALQVEFPAPPNLRAIPIFYTLRVVTGEYEQYLQGSYVETG